MALTIDGKVGRAIGVLMGVAAIVPALLFWAALGAISTNVPLPASAERAIESAVPLLARGPEQAVPLVVVVVPALFVAAFVVLGVLAILGALLKPDYAVNLRLGGGRGSGGP